MDESTNAKPVAQSAKPVVHAKPAPLAPRAKKVPVVQGKPVAKPAPAKRKTVEEKIAEAVAAALAARPATVVVERGYRAYATKSVPTAMDYFGRWIAREFPEFGIPVDESGRVTDESILRIVTVASKAYKAFQASDLGTARDN